MTPHRNGTRAFTRSTVCLLSHARRALAVAVGMTLVRLRTATDPLIILQAAIAELRIHVTRLEEENRSLRDRLTRIAPRHRSHYSPVERFRILVFMQTYGLSWADAADRFLVSVNTIARWMRDAT
ncbi:MAG TPA: hypothetical protein VJM31_00675, partial [Vicinamibacterales bacterium]|nr:hypothetical protein [Vicinamibacterales bacterium]